jgi:hypothetical protein
MCSWVHVFVGLTIRSQGDGWPPDQRSMLVSHARSTKLVEAWLSIDHQYALDGFFSVATQPSVGA